MSVEMHFLSLHLDYLPRIVATTMKNRESDPTQTFGRWKRDIKDTGMVNMLADYCWCLKRDLSNSTHKKKMFKGT